MATLTEGHMANSAIRALLSMIIFVLGAQPNGSVEAAEIKALITIGVQSAIEDLAPQFERATGHKVVTVFGLSAALSKRVADGEPTDVFIGTREGVNGLIQAGTISAGSDATLASSGMGVAVRAGTPKPDISTPDALKRTLLATRAIGYGNPAAGGASGVHFAKIIERLGIVEQMKAKTKYPSPGTFAGSMLVSGEVDLAAQQIPELIFVKGAEVVGPLPGDLQATTVFAAGVPVRAKEANAARALITFLQSPEAVAIYKAKGFDPR